MVVAARECGLFVGELSLGLPTLPLRALSIAGSHVGTLQELREVGALAKRKKLKAMPLTTRPSEQVNSILEQLKAGRVLGRVVLGF